MELENVIFRKYACQAKEVDFILQGAIKGLYARVRMTCLDLHFTVK